MGRPKWAVIFDVDGTLIDSARRMFKDCCRMAQKLSLRIPSWQEFLAVWARPWAELLDALWPGVSEEAFNEQFEETPAEAVPGARRVLHKLKKDGCFFAVISNRERESLEERMERVGMPFELFDYVQPVDDFIIEGFPITKPDPRVFNYALALSDEKGIPRSRVIYVGDTLSDCAAAQGAGIMFIAVLTGGTTREQFVAAGLGEEFILDSIRGLPEFLLKREILAKT